MEERKEILKKLIKELHEGTSSEEAKEKLKETLGSVTQTEISQVEGELIQEGIPIEEIHKLCDIHLTVFKESIENEKIQAPAWHPIYILMEEHKKMLEFSCKLPTLSKEIKFAESLESISEKMENLNRIIEHLKDSENHYLREENVLFPYLEKHGVTQPPAIMWMEHDRIREMKKSIYTQVGTSEESKFRGFARNLKENSLGLAEMLSSHFYKENNILFPTAMKVMEKEEWTTIKKQFGEVGYCCFTPTSLTMKPEEEAEGTYKLEEEGKITLETGSLSKDEIEAILNNLPVDITFVGNDDTVRYFSQSKDRIFVRTKAVIGRTVQKCHPQKSVHIVTNILESFKNGSRDSAEFWMNLDDRLVHIRYFAVKDKNKKYLGTMEVTQDIKNIKKIEGEKRILDWE
jgi:DUF438 domain-containing protein